MKPKISVVIPAYNAEKTIGDTIQALLNQHYPKKNYEIIVVDDGSNDSIRKIIKKFKRVKLFGQKHKGPAAARNLGVKHSKGNIILFTDADCIPDKNWIKNIVHPFKDKDIVGVGGTYKTLNKNNLIARFVGYEIEDRHEKLKKEMLDFDFIGTYSAAYRKDIFLKFDGFDERFPMASAEDPDLSFKMSEAGLKMLFQPKAFVYHRHPDTLFKFLKVKFWRGYWRMLLYKKHQGKMFRHKYTPKSIYLEIAFLGLSIIFFILNIFGLIHWIYGVATLILTFLLPSPLSFRIFKKDKITGIFSLIIIILRNFAIGLGILCGLIFLIKD